MRYLHFLTEQRFNFLPFRLNDAINALTVVLGNDTKDHEVSNTQTLQLLGNKLDKHQHMLVILIRFV